MLNNILLLLLIWPIYLDMCPGVYLNTHIFIYEQDEWLLETDEDWWTIFIVGPASARDNVLLLLFLLGNYITPGHVSSNLGIKTLNTNRQSCDHYKHNIIPVYISFSHPDVSYHFYSLLDNYQCTKMSRSMSGVLWAHVVLKLYIRISCHSRKW